MAGKLLGFEIGNSSLKIAVCSGNQLMQTVEVPLPENMVRETGSYLLTPWRISLRNR